MHINRSITLFAAAYLAEVYRAGIQAVDPGQREAAQMLADARRVQQGRHDASRHRGVS